MRHPHAYCKLAFSRGFNYKTLMPLPFSYLSTFRCQKRPILAFVSYLVFEERAFFILHDCSLQLPRAEVLYPVKSSLSYYLNMRTLSRSNIIFTVPASLAKSTCLVSRESVFHKSQFCWFPVVA